MGKRITSLGLLLLVSFYMIAQENATQSINEIKRQSDIYLYAESTSQTWEEALDNAKYLLGVEIETWAKTIDSKPADGYIAEAQNHILNLKSMRGDRFRAFVYVKKSDIVPYESAAQLVVVPVSEKHQTTISEVSPSRSTEEVPVTENQNTTINEVTPTLPQNATAYKPSKLEEEIMSVTDAGNIGTFIKRLKSEGRLGEYGKYKDMPANIDCYLFIYNRELAIPAYLHKVGGKFINIKSGEQDHVSNYSGCGAWWFQIK
jgi:hypothetical protein